MQPSLYAFAGRQRRLLLIGLARTRVRVIAPDIPILRLRAVRGMYYTAGVGQDLSPLFARAGSAAAAKPAGVVAGRPQAGATMPTKGKALPARIRPPFQTPILQLEGSEVMMQSDTHGQGCKSDVLSGAVFVLRIKTDE